MKETHRLNCDFETIPPNAKLNSSSRRRNVRAVGKKIRTQMPLFFILYHCILSGQPSHIRRIAVLNLA